MMRRRSHLWLIEHPAAPNAIITMLRDCRVRFPAWDAAWHPLVILNDVAIGFDFLVIAEAASADQAERLSIAIPFRAGSLKASPRRLVIISPHAPRLSPEDLAAADIRVIQPGEPYSPTEPTPALEQVV
jgi:hypothetical protein